MSLRDQFPLRLIIGDTDYTHLLSDGASFSNTDDGGYEAASFPLPRDAPSIVRGTHVVLMSGLSTVWEGRVSQPQRSLSHQTLLQCEGYSARLKDLAGSMVFVDRDLTKWGQPSYSRQIAIANANEQLSTSQVAADPTNNLPALAQGFTDAWVSPFSPLAEAWYDAGPGNLIDAIYYNAITGTVAFNNIAGLVAHVQLSSDDVETIAETSGNLTTTTGTAGYFTPATSYRRAVAQFYTLTTPGGAAGGTYQQYWRNLALYGNHGLTGRGSDPVGYYPSDIFGWVVSQIPDLQAGTIQQTDASGYIVPHYVQYLPVTLDTIATDMATMQGWHWGVWESPSPLTGDPRPRVDFRPRPAPGAFTAFCHRSDCDTLDIREDLSGQYNACTVTYTSTAGVQDAQSVAADNPILDQAGIATRTLILNGGTMTPATASVFAAEALALTNAQARVAGTISLISAIGGPSGPMAPWSLKAGLDRLRVGDAPSTDAFGATSDYPISRVETSIGSSGITTSVEIGRGGASLVESLQARLSAATALAANGGG